MSPSKMETFKVSISRPAAGFPPMMRERLRQLGPGRTTNRAQLETVCGGFSKANHFLDATTKNGLLVPVRWGEYRVADEATMDLLAKIPLPLHQRFVSWARTIPKLVRRKVAFLGPRLWKYSELNLEEPAPVLRLEPKDRAVLRTAPQWGAIQFDMGEHETWIVEVDGDEAVRLGVPDWFDSMILVRSNADPRWRATAATWADRLDERATRELEMALATMKRLPAARGGLFAPGLGPGPPVRRRLVTPPWYETLHRDALESFARGLHG